jgi:hypothetical protein
MHIHIHIGIFICIWTCTQLVVARLELVQPNLVSASCVLMLHCVNHGLTRCNCNTIVPNFRLPLASSMLPEWLLLCFAGKVHRLHQSGTLSWVCRRSYRAGQTHIDLQLAFCLTLIALCFEIACSLLKMEPSLC